MTFKFFDKLSQDFSEFLSDKKEYNVVIEVDKEGNKKSFTAHSVFLRYRSSYFDKELENAPTNKNHIKTINKLNISALLFEIILKYIYGGIVNIKDTDTKTIYELMINANELKLKELSRKLESYLIESKDSWLRAHFSLVYCSIFDSNEFKDLKKFYNDIIVKYPNLIFDSGDFTLLQETALVSILKRDDLKVEEIKIWNYVIKWRIAQNPTLPADSKEWSKENFKALKITLQNCLPLIRYFHIPGEDIWEKMKPYKKILEKQLWDDMILCSMSSNKPVNSLILPARIITYSELPSRIISTPELPFSTIINNEHAAELSSWIDRKPATYSLSNIPYEFQLILRGSRDGFHPKKFWNIHGHAGTIVVTKVAGTDEIVGGYNPLAWDNSNGVKNGNDAIYYRNSNYQNIYGLEFGDYALGHSAFFSTLDLASGHGHAGTIVVTKVAGTDEIVGGYNPLAWDNSNGEFGDCEFIMKSKVSDFTQDKLSACFYDDTKYFNYEKPIRKTIDEFSIYDYEVFKIIKKQIPNCTIR
ncbi:hypothetical protein Glove_64g103 [Diversispora epigaea]|uniref:BTB domain-containing protein n=1 Tax=Diversispora epigaea TaxID=1348612 RepID=A0A397JM24_9GLOM|nr:hypothetical protein Glove_64g103 [Diversispora epigaea]